MDWRAHFDALGDHAAGALRPGEQFTLRLRAETSDFVRFNRGRVRQAGTVDQAAVTLRWIAEGRSAQADVTLSGDADEDLRRVDEQVAWLRSRLPALPVDPHLVLPDVVADTMQDDGGRPIDAREVAAAVVDAAAQGDAVDLVGSYAGGAMHHAFRDSRGQRNWFTRHGSLLDWCLVHEADKGVKCSWAGSVWDEAAFRAEMARGRADLAALALPPRRLSPGTYRSFLTPAALEEVMDIVARGGFSAHSQQRKQSCLARLVEGEVTLDPRVSLREDLSDGTSPAFQDDGFVRPATVGLVQGGRHVGSLVSPRSARKFGLPTNGAEDSEMPVSLVMEGGDLPSAEARAALGRGLWVSNLWYANHADPNTARITGMTRFATLWIEDGEVVGPVDVMRFDDSMYELLGDRLEALTAETAFLPSASTYGWRSTTSMRLPGLLVSGLRLTL